MASSDYKQILLEIGFARYDKDEVGAKASLVKDPSPLQLSTQFRSALATR